MGNFSEIIEEVKNFDYEELQELNFITSKYLDEIEREKIYQSHNDSVNEYENVKMKFSSDFNELKNILKVK
jgi:hypothetical protein